MDNRVSMLFAVLLAVVSGFAQAATITFSDGDFDLPPWSSMTISGASGGQTSLQESTDGNPGFFLSVTTVTNAPTSTAHVNDAFVYDPALGAIATIDVSLDYRNINSFGQGHGVSAVFAIQDGNVFSAANFITGSSDFSSQTFSATGLTPASFSSGSGQLDFSANGAPIAFGFLTSNSGGNGINVGYDNYSVSINTIPAPAALPLLASALAAFAWLRRR